MSQDHPQHEEVMSFEDYHFKMSAYELAVRRYAGTIHEMDESHLLRKHLKELVEELRRLPEETLKDYLRKRYEIFFSSSLDTAEIPTSQSGLEELERHQKMRREPREAVRMQFVHLVHDMNECDDVEYFMRVLNRSRRGMCCLYCGKQPPEVEGRYFWEEENGWSRVEIRWRSQDSELLWRLGIALL